MSNQHTFYLDHCGTTPLSAEVQDKIHEIIDTNAFGNPTAAHHVIGEKAEAILNDARADVAQALGARFEEVIFTSGATEANNLVLWGHALRFQGRNPQILFGATEHKSIYETCLALRSFGLANTVELEVAPNGQVDLDALEYRLRDNQGQPTLVALMHINNEIPVRHPVEQIARLCGTYGALFHCDGVQGFVREALNFSRGHFGSYVISPHKIYGPKGVGVLIIGKNDLSPRIIAPYSGGEQEYSLRPGTHNLQAIAAAATAITSHDSLRAERRQHMQDCAQAFAKALYDGCDRARFTLPINEEAAGIVSFYAEHVSALSLLEKIPNVCMNRGSSCLGANGEKFSHVPKALGLPVEVQANIIRASFGNAIDLDSAQTAGQIVAQVISTMKSPH